MLLPKITDNVKIPPIKIQGIKTKLTPFILKSISWDGNGVYFEPFVGSGVVGFNINPQRAVFSDTNPHLIQFYNDLQSKKINSTIVREFLEEEGSKLASSPADKNSYYYTVRDRFNKSPNSLDLLFLQRSNFNGMMRFNSSGYYNVPFGRKPHRFQKALITKITNQVKWLEEAMDGKDWRFECMTFEDAFKLVKEGDFVYLDPPYIGRHDGYYDAWSLELADQLAELTQTSGAGYAFSMWLENQYRSNLHMQKWNDGVLLTIEHFYYVGASEKNRNKITEALIVSKENHNKVT
ncbi:DNA adenine methylase Dam [Pasteurella langaaensis DSM 22999]|uniref:Site-specific DNA-methyltransferase (adenine-specific) n=1 Tax=Alitibacter langaaensis DSM 22999 TaxID=1122935 RepID=A0A2U0T891_9PAST|nr:Dam family site-specific DNA-(adenine-N6)-methyltransferase [Pasteurella langaaensis]PVX39788.1 DNA adenine methylase Dam [Pasteurella langaaensis DSM 22999]